MERETTTTGKYTFQPIAIGVVALAYLVLVVFYPVLGFEMVGADVNAQVVNNPYVHGLTWENVRQIFTTWGCGGSTSSYYPIRTLSYALDYEIWELDPRGYKLTNILIHSSNTLLVFYLIVRVSASCPSINGVPNAWRDVPAATFATAIFAIHPVVVEPVSWVPGREELLMTMGALGCFHLYFTARRLEVQNGKKIKVITCFAGATFCCLTACLSNAVGAVIPVLVTAWDIVMLDGSKGWRIFKSTGALWVIGVVTVIVKRIGEGGGNIKQPLDMEQAGQLSAVIQQLGYHTGFEVGEINALTIERLMLVPDVYAHNLKTLFWPSELAIAYEPVTARSFLEVEVVVGLFAAVATLGVLWMLRRKKLILFGLLWFCITLGPSAQIMPHHIHRADRFLYLPLAGLVLALGLSFQKLARSIHGRIAAGIAVAAGIAGVVLLNSLSCYQVQTWRNPVLLWENCVRAGPKNFLARRILARELERAEQPERAAAQREIVNQMREEHTQALAEFARHLMTGDDRQSRDYELAVKLAEWARDLDHQNSQLVVQTLALAYEKLAVDLAVRGEYASAIGYYHKTIDVVLKEGNSAQAALLKKRLRLVEQQMRDDQETHSRATPQPSFSLPSSGRSGEAGR